MRYQDSAKKKLVPGSARGFNNLGLLASFEYVLSQAFVQKNTDLYLLETGEG